MTISLQRVLSAGSGDVERKFSKAFWNAGLSRKSNKQTECGRSGDEVCCAESQEPSLVGVDKKEGGSLGRKLPDTILRDLSGVVGGVGMRDVSTERRVYSLVEDDGSVGEIPVGMGDDSSDDWPKLRNEDERRLGAMDWFVEPGI